MVNCNVNSTLVHVAGAPTFSGSKHTPKMCATFVLTNGSIDRICAGPNVEHKLQTFKKIWKSRFLALFLGNYSKMTHSYMGVKGPKFVLANGSM